MTPPCGKFDWLPSLPYCVRTNSAADQRCDGTPGRPTAGGRAEIDPEMLHGQASGPSQYTRSGAPEAATPARRA